MAKRRIITNEWGQGDGLQRLLAYGAVLMLLGAVEFVGLHTPIVKSIRWISQPVVVVTTAGVRAIEAPYYWLVYARSSARKIIDLELRYGEALSRLSQLEGVEEENRALRQLLENTDRQFREVIISQPIVSYAAPAISGGSQVGMEQGMVVVVKGVVVGLVDQVFDDYATISLLVYSREVSLLARTENGVEGLVVGNGKNVIFTEVSQESEITPGERVVTVGQPGIEPDLFLGLIGDIEQNPASPVQTATVRQPVNFYQSRVVEVLQ